MTQDKFKDKLFEILNETDNLPIRDIVTDDRNDRINVYLIDGTRFSIIVESCGNWCLYGV